MKWRYVVLMVLLCSSLLLPAMASGQENNTVCIYYFYGEGCSVCAETNIFLNNLASQYSLDIHRFEVYSNMTNRDLLLQVFEQYGVPVSRQGVPVVVIGNKLLLGRLEIEDNLEEEILANQDGLSCPIVFDPNAPFTLPELASFLVLITSAGLVDSINPCALAILLFLFSTVLQTGNSKRALKAGLAFSTSLYIAYFLFGLGLLSVVQFTGASLFFYQLVGLLTVAVGLLNVKDFFWYGGGGFLMEVPKSWRQTIQALIEKVTSPLGAFLLGFLVCLFELPCTGGPYLFVLAMLARRTTQLVAIPFLLYYNVLFILPLVGLSFAIHYGRISLEATRDWRDKNKRPLHLVLGITMILLGVALIFGLI